MASLVAVAATNESSTIAGTLHAAHRPPVRRGREQDRGTKEGRSINGLLTFRSARTRSLRARNASSVATDHATPMQRAFLLALLLASLAFSSLGVAHADAGQPGIVTSPDGLNLRAGPDTSYPVLAVMPTGAQVSIVGAAQNGIWLPVVYNGQSGFADGEYIAISGTAIVASGADSSGAATLAGTPSPPPSGTAVVLPSDGLNLRSGPSSNAGIITVMPAGARVTIAGPAQNGIWVPVIYNGQSGFADGTYLSLDGSVPIIAAGGVGASGSASAQGTSPTPSPTGTAAGRTATPTPPAPGGSKLAWPSSSRKISTPFSAAHLGIDIDQFDNPNEPIHASTSGTVVFAGGNPCCSYGLYVDVDNGAGILTRYAHMAQILVKQGQIVRQGDVLGIVGCTGKCTGNHIHFEVHINGRPVDPLSLLPPPWQLE